MHRSRFYILSCCAHRCLYLWCVLPDVRVLWIDLCALRNRLLERYPKLDQFEAVLLNNLLIDTADEAFSLIPTLRDKFSEDELTELLDGLKAYQTT